MRILGLAVVEGNGREMGEKVYRRACCLSLTTLRPAVRARTCHKRKRATREKHV